jgi:hypothetical protein
MIMLQKHVIRKLKSRSSDLRFPFLIVKSLCPSMLFDVKTGDCAVF